MSVPWDSEFLAKLEPLDYTELWDLFDLIFYRRKKDDPAYVRNPWDPNFSSTLCVCLIGAPGIGKSAIVRAWATAHNFELRQILMGQGAEEDNMGIARQEYDESGHHVYSMPAWMPVDETDGGIAFIDETGTGRDTHQNIIAHILTAGYTLGYFGHKIPKNWFFIAAMNPEDGQYLLNMNLDPRVKDRLMPVYVKPTSDSIISFLGNHNKIPEKLHGFLLMHPEMAHCVSPRTWESIGQILGRTEVLNKNLQLALKVIRGKFITDDPKNGSIVEAIAKYYKVGNDPLKYPISPHRALFCTKKEHEQNLAIIKKWCRNGAAPYVAATVMGLTGFIKDEEASKNLDKEHWKKIAEIASTITIKDQVHNLISAARDTRHARLAVQVCREYKTLKETLSDLLISFEDVSQEL